jgi:hypothetical protein
MPLPTAAAAARARSYSLVVSPIVSRQPERLKPVNRVRLLLSPLWFLVALVGLIASITVSGNAAHGTETGVRAFDTPTAIGVGSGTTESPGGVGHLRQVSAAFASATGVATNSADDLVAFAEKNRATGFASEYTSPSGQRYCDVTKNRGALDADGPLGAAHHGGCSEVGCMLQALDVEGQAGMGGTMRTIYNRPPNSPIAPGPPRGLGAPATPCSSCQTVLNRNGVRYS